MIITRRSMLSLCAMPAIVRAASLMPVSARALNADGMLVEDFTIEGQIGGRNFTIDFWVKINDGPFQHRQYTEKGLAVNGVVTKDWDMMGVVDRECFEVARTDWNARMAARFAERDDVT